MNIPNIGVRNEIPEEAQGNPVYEQTAQDMPLWCCGRNCAFNTRVTCAILALIGIGCSLWVCMASNYFSFVALRNDTFFDPDKAFPAPFEYATEAKVGLFKYEILDVFEYPWPPKPERALADKMLLEELRRMQEVVATESPTAVTSNAPQTSTSKAPSSSPSNGPTTKPSKSPTKSPTKLPTTNPTVNLDDCEGVDSLEPGPGSVACGVTPSPTGAPSASPTITNPNDIIAETVQIGVVLPYEKGTKQFDSTFTHAQKGAIFGPVFALLATLFSLSEVLFCTYKCSWLPAALFMYLAFMFQLFTLFLFLSETWCKYDQDCALGSAGYGSVIAVICYMIAQNLLCCSPRPDPIFNLCKKKTPRRKKKKKQSGEDGENDGLTNDFDEPSRGQRDNFRDEDEAWDNSGRYDDPDEQENDLYSSGYGNDSYYTEDDGAGYGNDPYDTDDNGPRDSYYDNGPRDSYYTQDDDDDYDNKRY